MEKFKPREYNQFVDTDYQNKIYKYLTDINFPWYFMEDATDEFIHNTPEKSTPSFGNLIYYNQHETNTHYEFFKPLIDNLEVKCDLKIKELLRVRAGFLLNTKYTLLSAPYRHNTPHRDFQFEHYTAVYYVNQADGETVIFNETAPKEKYSAWHKCMPDKGKLLLFNGWHYHASTCPKVFTKRLAITINFTVERI